MRWLLVAAGLSGVGVGAVLWWYPQPAAPQAVVPASNMPVPTVGGVSTGPKAVATNVDAFSLSPAPQAPTPAQDSPEATPLSPAEAITLMQVMAEQGDPRSPALLQSAPRALPSAAQLADPQQYSDYEQQQLDDLLRSYTGIVKDIPQIKQRIDQAEQLGERTPEEIREARLAVEQLSAMQARLQQEKPSLLPQ
ncbi:hypothetical protein [Atopomonas sediminilitoris]|uniref:hypothetical protein n=1 Tax=Atopomonas sediminilitoris TaxID=2919919 RepID=UPI001F4F0CD7|nr:hypothetical protein [Atopomonas sediminilitoris]MCJ8169355.1 hypothetical protein [Atopomonas sediminilitoris]